MHKYLVDEAVKANLNYDSEEHIFVNPVKKIISED